MAYYSDNWKYHENYHAQKIRQIARIITGLNAATQHPLNFLRLINTYIDNLCISA